MSDLSVRTVDGGETIIDEDALARLAAALEGQLLTEESPAYDEARAIWNAMIDRRPGLIARCATVEDVILALTFARERGLVASVRGAGHNIAGNAVADGALMIDLSEMNSVEVDPAARKAWVGPGATLGQVDAATQAFGLALPVGINSTTGIAGLTLGGGFGWLTRKYGMTIDSLISADVVTAAGERLKASETENPDLFWGIRGGGGNFGIVTSFEFRLHPVGPEVLCGLIVHPFEDAPGVLRRYREVATSAPDELTAWVVLRKAPPLPFLPEEIYGKEIVVIAAIHAGDIEEAKRGMRPLRSIGDPIADVIAPQKFEDFQQAFDPLLAPGSRNYWKSHDFTELSDGVLDVVVEYAEKLPTEQCEILLAQLGGAASRQAADATAYPHRDAEFVINLHTRWEDAADDERCIGWARQLFERSAPFATGGVYVNFMPEDETDRVNAAYGSNYERLVRLKYRYDPDNFFRLNQNIQPSVAS